MVLLMVSKPELGKNVRILGLVEIPEAGPDHCRVGVGGRAFQNKMLPIIKISGILWILLHALEAIKGLKRCRRPLPPASRELQQPAQHMTLVSECMRYSIEHMVTPLCCIAKRVV